jgi:hypothetical protein
MIFAVLHLLAALVVFSLAIVHSFNHVCEFVAKLTAFHALASLGKDPKFRVDAQGTWIMAILWVLAWYLIRTL